MDSSADGTNRGTALPRVGAVDGSIEATTRSFYVVLDDQATVQLDDLVVCRQELADGTSLAHYGIVVEQSEIIEGAEFPSDTRHISLDRTMPGHTSRRAEVQVLRTVPERWVAPSSGTEVFHAVADDRGLALFADQMDQPLAVGLDQSEQAVHADFSFMNGTQGGHVSISGVSGVAAKTSYALFLLYMIFESPQGQRLLGQGAVQARALVFNVKGEDLLHLDQANKRFADGYQEQWQALGVNDPGAFRSVRFYAPPAPGSSDQLVTEATSRRDSALSIYGWTPESFIRQGLLRFCFTEAHDRGTQVDFVEQAVRTQLARHAYPLAGEDGAVIIAPQPHTWSKVFERVVERRPDLRGAGDGEVIRDYQDLLDLLIAKLDPEEGDPEWTARVQPGTLMAFIRRLAALTPRLGHLIRTGVTEVRLERQVTVVDIHNLHESAQRFVVGALVSRTFDEKQGTGREPLRFVMLDELNKYAPREGRGHLKELFIDIVERGRSLGVLLVGCQQSAGRVAEPLVRQPALKVVGRVDTGESADYGFLTSELRERASRFLPGTMVLDQPLVPAPLPVRFPFPPFATNVDDAAIEAEDTAAGEAAMDAL